jgi:hypothetical protein
MKSDRLLRHLVKNIFHLADWLAHAAGALPGLLKSEAARRPLPVRINDGVPHDVMPHVRDFRRRGPDRWRGR